jgi:hypothetical protein
MVSRLANLHSGRRRGIYYRGAFSSRGRRYLYLNQD